MSQPIWYDSTEAGAPTLNNVAGSLLGVLRACLVTGFGSKAVTSIAVASGVATATCATHGFRAAYGKLVLIDGSAEPLLNGNKQIGDVLTNSFTYPAPGVADGTYTGTLSAKRAPLGWTEPHTGTHVAMFARSAPEATAMLLRVTDTAVAPASVGDARAVMVESATDIENFVGLTPTEAQLAGGQFWHKGANTTAAKSWAIFGDDRLFYYAAEAAVQGPMTVMSFGDIETFKPVDAFHSAICGSISQGAGSPPPFLVAQPISSVTPNGSGFRFARRSDQLTSAVGGITHSVGLSNTNLGSAGQVYPSPVDGGMVLCRPVFASEAQASGQALRGFMPGLAAPLGTRPFPHLSLQSGFAGDPSSYVAVNYGNNGQVLFDVGASWR